MYKYPIRSNEIYHYGIKRRSGRYPYGSGMRPYQDREKKIKKLNKYQDKISAYNSIKNIHEKSKTDSPFMYTISGLRFQNYMALKIGDINLEKYKRNVNRLINELKEENDDLVITEKVKSKYVPWIDGYLVYDTKEYK